MSFAADLTKFANKTGIKMDIVIRKLTFDVFGFILKKSPVDTGRFRANWRVSLNQATTKYDETLTSKDIPVAITDAAAVSKKAKWGTSVFICNNTPYAEFLELGSSKQAPSGVLRVSMFELQVYVSKLVLSAESL